MSRRFPEHLTACIPRGRSTSARDRAAVAGTGARRDEVDVLQRGDVVAGEQQVGDLVGGFLDVAVQGAAPYVQCGGGVIHPLPGGAGDVSAEPGGEQERAPGVFLQVRGARQQCLGDQVSGEGGVRGEAQRRQQGFGYLEIGVLDPVGA